MINLDNAFINNMQALLGEEFDSFITSLNEPEQKAIYVNENKISVKEFKNLANFKTEPIPYEKAGFYVDNIRLGKHPLHHAGAIYVQDASAMFTVNAIEFNGDETVLDMCASPGGKSIQIANRIKNGVLVSNEIVKSRADVLFSNIERMGLKNVIITNETPQNIASAYPNCFDVCLVDAPCSGEGMFRRGEEYLKSWNENLPDMCSVRQLEILAEADKCLKQGGKLIYSTCTYSVKENEQVIREFLANHNYKLINIKWPFTRGINMPESVRIYPHKNRGEGQFVAVLLKLSANENDKLHTNLKFSESKLASQFLQNFTNLSLKVYDINNNIYYIPNLNLIKKGIKYRSYGVLLGEINGKIFKPSHNLFSAFGGDFKQQLSLTLEDENLKSYLHGDTFPVSQKDGFGALLIGKIPLGGYKISDGKFKNLYPKGLRNQ